MGKERWRSDESETKALLSPMALLSPTQWFRISDEESSSSPTKKQTRKGDCWWSHGNQIELGSIWRKKKGKRNLRAGKERCIRRWNHIIVTFSSFASILHPTSTRYQKRRPNLNNWIFTMHSCCHCTYFSLWEASLLFMTQRGDCGVDLCDKE